MAVSVFIILLIHKPRVEEEYEEKYASAKITSL